MSDNLGNTRFGEWLARQDEQTDDLQGFPNVNRIEYAFMGHPLPAPVRIPPCTGYDSDYEREEAYERQ